MSNCGCNQQHGAGVIAGPCIPPKCLKQNENLRIKTVVLQPSLGTDEKGQPYAPRLGAYTNTIVQYQANGALYLYDSRGIFTKVTSDATAVGLETEVARATEAENYLQQNINQLANKEAEDVNDLQANINAEVEARTNQYETLHQGLVDENSRAYNAEQEIKQDVEGMGDILAEKQDILIGEGEGQNLKTINGESLLGEGNIVIPGGESTPENLTWVFGGNDDTPKQVSIVSATFNTAPSLGLSIPYFDYSDNEVKPGNVDVFPFATTDRAGLMSASDKTKLDSLSASTNLTSVPTASYTADNVNLAFGDETLELTPAVGTAGGAVSKSGIMSAFQASQLEALAAAYEAEEKGTVLYEGTASVNNIELSESGLSYDHLIIVAQYMGMGSFALEQQVSEVFYPTDNVKSFQMNATDITTGNTPTVELIQDIWSITEDGMELELASALKASVNSETTVEPDTTSHFTITKVVGFGKKLAETA